MTDQTIKEALLAIANHSNKILEGHIALSKVVANRMPGLSPEEKKLWLTAIESDEKRIKDLQDTLQHLQN